jgi:CubicO group peptidase (beta-lactamase class C family)
MMLAEQHRLAYDDTVSTFLRGFEPGVGAVTIRQLLTHTSGIPDYPDLNVDHPGVTNGQILTALQKVQRLAFVPGAQVPVLQRRLRTSESHYRESFRPAIVAVSR